ncbi:MAG: hypothetical protein U1E76_15590 [Planctomycetota bacterium]
MNSDASAFYVRGQVRSLAGSLIATAFDRRDRLESGTFGVWTFAVGQKAFDNLRDGAADGAVIYAQDFEQPPLACCRPSCRPGRASRAWRLRSRACRRAAS